MNPKRIIGSAVIVLVVAAGLWWFTQPAPAPEKVAVAPVISRTAIPEAHYSVDPKSPALHPPPQPAMVPPPPVQRTPRPPGADPAPAPPSNGNPQADLKTALPDFVRLVKAGDFMTLFKTYAPPEEVAKMQPDAEAEMAAHAQDPETLQSLQAMINAIEYAQTQTPTLSADGNTAVYSNVPNYAGRPNQPTRNMTWIKENGQWYLKD